MFFPEAAARLSIRLLHPEPSAKIIGAAIDTRTLTPGNLFVALKGTQQDGHLFLAEAFEKGASGALVEKAFVERSGESLPAAWKNLLPVESPGEAFLKLSSFYRDSFPLKAVVGIVGSVGKTSTKEFLSYLLRKKFETLATQGNLNNHLGLPLTLFRLQPNHKICVCELGTNHLGDVQQLAEVLKPDLGLLTRVAPEHLEGFGSMDAVYQGELELFECLRAGSYAVIPDDDPILLKKISRFNLKWIRVGFTENADYKVSEVRVSDNKVHFKVNGYAFAFPGRASFLALNAAKAIAMAELCGVEQKEMPESWEDLKLPDGRFQVQTLPSGAQVIFDGYNASPASFEAAIKSFEEICTEGRKILVFSDMLELGEDEKKYHEALGVQIGKSSIDSVIAYGTRAAWSLEALRRENFPQHVEGVANAREAAEKLRGLQKGDWVLLKASRSMKVEEVLQHLSGVGQTVLH